jgi:tetratricopeptide (TPR) repeat protein
MHPSRTQSFFAFVFVTVFCTQAPGQSILDPEPPRLAPSRLTPADLNRRQARECYALGVLCERRNQLTDALKAFEKVVVHDPDSLSALRELVPLYLTFDRGSDALATSRRVLELDPADCETWCLYARQLKAMGRLAEAQTGLEKAWECPALKENSESFLQVASELAETYESRKDDRRALAIYREVAKALERGKDNVRLGETYECIGRICQRAGHHGSALEAFARSQSRFLAEDPLRASTLNLDLATTYEARGEPEAALIKLDQYLQTQPPGTEPYEFRSRLLRQLGRENEMLGWLKQASERDAHNLSLKMILARQYAKEGKANDAEQAYLQITAESSSPDAYRELYKLYQAQKRLGEVLRILNDAVARDSGDVARSAPATQAGAIAMVLRGDRDLAQAVIVAARAPSRDRKALRPETCRFLALLADSWRQYDAAEEFYRDYLALGADPQVEPLVYARLLEVLWMADKRDAIVGVCRAGLRSAHVTNRALFHRHLARALIVSGKITEALAEADQVVQLANDQNRIQSRLFRAQLLSNAEQCERAEAECVGLLREAKRPEDVRDIRQTLSVVYSNAGKVSKAEEQLTMVLDADPDDATANNDLGYLMADQNHDLDRAERLIRKAIQLDREQKKSAARGEQDDDAPIAAYIDSLGWVLFRRGQLAEARRELEKAVSLPEGKTDPVVWDHLGDVYFRLGRVPRAKEAWQKAITLFDTERRRSPGSEYRKIKQKLESQQADAPG